MVFSGATEDIRVIMLSEEDKVEDVTVITGGYEVVDVEESTCKCLVVNRIQIIKMLIFKKLLTLLAHLFLIQLLLTF